MQAAVVNVQVNQNYQQASDCMVLGGFARRVSWVDGVFYRFVDGQGLVLVDSNNKETHEIVEPSPNEVAATDWTTLSAPQQFALPVPVDVAVTRICGLDFITRDEVAAHELHAQQGEDVAREITTDGCDFVEAMEIVLSGRGTAWRASPTDFPELILFTAPSLERLDPPGLTRAVMYEAEAGELKLYRPDPEDIVATDWVINFTD